MRSKRGNGDLWSLAVRNNYVSAWSTPSSGIALSSVVDSIIHRKKTIFRPPRKHEVGSLKVEKISVIK